MWRKRIMGIIAMLACLTVGGVSAGPASALSFVREEEPNDTAQQADVVAPTMWRYGIVAGHDDYDVFARRGITRVTVTNTSRYGSGPIRVYFPDVRRTYFVYPGHSAWVSGGSNRYWHFVGIDALDYGYHSYRLTAR